MSRNQREAEAFYSRLAEELTTVAIVRNSRGQVVGLIVRETPTRFHTLFIDQYRSAGLSVTAPTIYFSAVVSESLEKAERRARIQGYMYTTEAAD